MILMYIKISTDYHLTTIIDWIQENRKLKLPLEKNIEKQLFPQLVFQPLSKIYSLRSSEVTVHYNLTWENQWINMFALFTL